MTEKPVTYVVYSHAHIDHIGAAGIFPKNATFIAQQETAAELQVKESKEPQQHELIIQRLKSTNEQLKVPK